MPKNPERPDKVPVMGSTVTYYSVSGVESVLHHPPTPPLTFFHPPPPVLLHLTPHLRPDSLGFKSLIVQTPLHVPRAPWPSFVLCHPPTASSLSFVLHHPAPGIVPDLSGVTIVQTSMSLVTFHPSRHLTVVEGWPCALPSFVLRHLPTTLFIQCLICWALNRVPDSAIFYSRTLLLGHLSTN